MYFNGLMDSKTYFNSIGPGLFLDEFDTNTLFSGFEGSMNYPPTFPTLPPYYPPTFLTFILSKSSSVVNVWQNSLYDSVQ